MAWHIGTQGQCRNVVARLNTQFGYPRTASEGDRIGGGVHVPLAQVPVTVRWSYVARLSDGTFGVRIKQRVVRHLTAAQELRVVADLPDGVTINREDED